MGKRVFELRPSRVASRCLHLSLAAASCICACAGRGLVSGCSWARRWAGAFIDIGGVSGLLHISQISHDHISDIESVLKVRCRPLALLPWRGGRVARAARGRGAVLARGMRAWDGSNERSTLRGCAWRGCACTWSTGERAASAGVASSIASRVQRVIFNSFLG